MIKKYKEIIILLVCLIGVSQLYLYTMFPAFKNNDSPEIITAAYTLGICHPPAYPLFTMAAKVFSLLPVGSPAFRINSFVIFLAIIVLLLSYFIIKQIIFRIFAREDKIINFAGFFILALSFIFWNQAIEAKGGIYILNLLLFGALIYLSMELFKGFNPTTRKTPPVEAGFDNAPGREHIRESPVKTGSSTIKYLYLISYVFGLSLTNHWPSMIILLPVFGYLFFKYRGRIKLENIMTSALLLLAGFSPYLYLPIRSGNSSIFVFMAWPNTWENFWWTIFRTGYTGIVPPPSLHLYAYQIKEFFVLLFSNYSILWILIPAGAYIIYKKSKEIFYFYLGAFLIISIAVVFYNRSEESMIWISDIFLMPAQYILMLFIISGMCLISGFLDPAARKTPLVGPSTELSRSQAGIDSAPGREHIIKFFKGVPLMKAGSSTTKAFRYGFLTTVLLLILFLGYKNFEKNNNRYNYQAYDFGHNTLQTMDKNSLFLCEGDYNFMPFFYVQIIEKQRQDIKLLRMWDLYLQAGIDDFVKKFGNVPVKEKAPAYNLNNIIDYYSVNGIEIYKSTYSPVMDKLKVHDFVQKGLLQEYLTNKKQIPPEIFQLYSYNRGLYDKYIDYSRVTSDLVITYSFCMMLKANELFNGGNPAEALKLYKKAMLFPFKDEMKGNEPVLYYKLANIYKGFNDEDSQIKYLKRAIELKKDYWQAYQALGEVYQKDGNITMAKEMLENADKYGSPDKKAIEQINSGNSEMRNYLESGDAKFGRGDDKGAIEDYTKAIESDPKYAEAYCNRGAAEYKLGDYKAALEDCNKAVEFAPDLSTAYYNRGNAEDGMGDYKKSIKDYSKAIEIKPKYTEAYSNRGIAKLSSGDNTGAIEDYSKVLEFDPKYEAAYYNRGIAKTKSGDYKGAIEDYSKAIELNPKYAEAFSNRGNAKTKSGDYNGAIEDYNKALEINPKQANAYYNRGYVKYFTGDRQGALEDLNKAGKLGVKQAYDMIEKIQGK